MLNNDFSTWTLADLKAEEKRLSERLAAIKVITGGYDHLQNLSNGFSAPIEQPTLGWPAINQSLAKETTHDAAVILLKEKGTKLKTRYFLDEFAKRGKIINAIVPMTSLYSSLVGATERKNSELLNLGDGEWGLKGRDEQ
ncbi:MAG: hypothetical protein DI586_01055 [Micavibrio aeruginosavorus]|uniref:Uncharacterized protein n=1 Tax=Micavibrio aeruginosavorus TaxID=349221 RepID=A0A2W5FTV7_9BACT|nr:MAG: hypothetical protein DI586_01055 [Micavibrio aeruginosavorus]